MLADRGFPAEATARFGNLEAVNYTAAAGIAAKLKSRDPVMAATVARDLSVVFRGNYRKAMELAEAGR
jgi:hypothetical protein